MASNNIVEASVSSQFRRPNGRFEKRKKFDKELTSVENMANTKEKRVENDDVVKNSVCKGQRVVDLCELGRNLKCDKCKNVLDLENTVAEKHVGLHSVLSIACKKCEIMNAVHTGKINKSGDGQHYAESNVTATLGSIHSGVGHTALKKLLACMDIPCFTNAVYKRYENIVGLAIEEAAKDSCKRAAEEERQLVLENVEKICQELPESVVKDIFPHLSMLRSCQDKTISPQLRQTDENSPNPTFDAAIGNIVNIIISYDMGWSKRGNGRSYDSLNGYATIIGFLSNKILDYTTCNRKCAKCDKGHNKDDHDCRLNFQGSAKAMEAHAGVELITKSNISREIGLNVRAVIGDEDSSMIAAVRKESDEFIHKLADKNHLVKHFTNEWYGLAKNFKQLNKKGAISHLKKCFTYAIAQNKGQGAQLGDVLRNLPNHLYGRHENCGGWCHRQGSSEQTIKFTDAALYDEMTKVFTKYANNAAKFAMAASSQTNESVNNIIAHKAPKNICLSKSASCDFRVASAVCSKNDGEQSVNSIRTKLNLSHGDHANKYAIRADKKRKKRASLESTKPKKLRRLQLKISRESLRKKEENVEGISYLSNYGINQSHEEKSTDVVSQDNCTIVYFDLETTNLEPTADILQIAAILREVTFNVYIHSSQEVAPNVTEITGLKIFQSQLYLHDKQLETRTQEEALLAFHQFLTNFGTGCLLVAHNASFDTPRLLRLIAKYNMIDQYRVITGFADTLIVFRKGLPNRKGPGLFKLKTLHDDFIRNENDSDSDLSFHNGVFDVQVLQKLALHFKVEEKLFSTLKTFQNSLIELNDNCKINRNLQEVKVFKKNVSPHILRKMAKAEITSDFLINVYKKEGESKIIAILSDKVDGKPRVSNNKKVLQKIITHLSTYK